MFWDATGRTAAFRLSAVLYVTVLFSCSCQGDEHGGSSRVRFNKQIRPILSDKCLQCHGPDAGSRKGGFRVDDRESVVGTADSGLRPVVPGMPEQSQLLVRIHSNDADLTMPPAASGKFLTEEEKGLLQRWIVEGAEYESHWAYLPISRPPIPDVSDSGWVRNPIDAFLLSRLERENLHPSVEASDSVLLRRLSLDLTGLPPSVNDLDQFLLEMNTANDRASRDEVYSRWISHYLASPHYGERMAVDWMDAARYADTNGYQVDRDRDMYAWRDWVIEAFNRNMRFDEFTVEQLAGDLLADATLSQKIATGFHRNHMLNEEGGIIPEEFLAEYCADRVETTATVWLGQTMNCARCHDHKFDPITQRDFYGLYAFFHNITEQGVGNYGAVYRLSAPPLIRLPSPEIERQVSELEKSRDAAADGAERTKIQQQIDALQQQIPTAMVMEELSVPRETRIMLRGNYAQPGDIVTASTPERLPGMPASLPKNRLGLARWLVDPGNPLTARVIMNRLWQSVFGVGIVKTSEDFGTQGELPVHPELLDWLASEFVSSGWDVQHMLKLMMTSSAYRQHSGVTSELLSRDPENRLLARGVRYRLQSEFIRDQALSASGLLVAKIGGPSVKPYHPAGFYEQVTAGSGTNVYVEGQGEDLYRRSMYTYWKRSVPNPAMLIFDSPFRETCSVRRTRTNTPLQALNLMNDPTYIEAARVLAMRILREGGSTVDSQVNYGMRVVLSREPSEPERAILVAAYERTKLDFQGDPVSVDGYLAAGKSSIPEGTDRVALAAMAVVSGTILNLDEAITRE
ncbi:MAG: PSD1 domain-containing protein [Planctomyces sp.]|nr:PSD1 domain-containing protein [Planctomyces sp.]